MAGGKFLHLRCSMTCLSSREPYRFFTDRSESKFAKEGFRVNRRIYFLFFRIAVIVSTANRFLSLTRTTEKHFTHAVGWPLHTSNFYKDPPPLGVHKTNNDSSEGSPLATASFQLAEKWKECRCLARWDRLPRHQGILFMYCACCEKPS